MKAKGFRDSLRRPLLHFGADCPCFVRVLAAVAGEVLLHERKPMTKKEHELIVLMFARLYESIGIIEETLKSRGIWSGDDPKAFSHAVHADDRKILHYVERARSDYLSFANQLGVILVRES